MLSLLKKLLICCIYSVIEIATYNKSSIDEEELFPSAFFGKFNLRNKASELYDFGILTYRNEFFIRFTAHNGDNTLS